MEWCTSLVGEQQQCVYWYKAMIWKDLMARHTWSITAQRTGSDRPVWGGSPSWVSGFRDNLLPFSTLLRGAWISPVLVPDLISSLCPKDFMYTVYLRYHFSEAYNVQQTIGGGPTDQWLFLQKLGWKRKYTKI